MSSNYLYNGTTDLDAIFKARGLYTPHVVVNYQVGGVDIANLYASTANLGPGLRDTPSTPVGFQTASTDLSSIFRDINCPDSFLTGPSSVTSGSFNGERWTYSGTTNNSTITGVIFNVVGHGAGIFTAVSTTAYTGSVIWTSPFGNPSISNSPGTYTFYFQAMDSNHLVGDRRMTVTVN